MSIYKKQTFYVTGTTNSEDTYQSFFEQITTAVFGGAELSDFFKLKRSSDYMYLYTSSTSVTDAYSLGYSKTNDGLLYKNVTWIDTGNLIKLDSIWLWKGQYASHYNDYLMDITTGEYYTGSLKAVNAGIAIAPLYTSDGILIDGAYMYGGSGIFINTIYEIGGALYMAVYGNVLIAL